MIAKMIKLECITNLHVGNGEVNFNIIDNEVERDPVTGYPTINSSGVKGALREFFVRNSSEYVDELFGAEGKGDKSSSPGLLKILCADMVAMPVRASKGEQAFYMVSTEGMIEKFRYNMDTLLGKTVELAEKEVSQIAVEGFELSKAVTLFEKDLYIMKKEDFDKLSLPVMARNHLENGISQNLWYEEIVPHKSIFCITVLAENESVIKHFTDFVDGKVVQFGGNASIGYGLCKVTVLEA